MQTTLSRLATAPASIAVEQIRTGIAASAFPSLAEQLGVSQHELASKLRVAPRTISRLISKHQRLPSDITEKLIRIVRVMNKARMILADQGSVVSWLNTEAPALNGIKPIDLLDTDVGASQVEGLIIGLAYGNFQ